MMASQTCERCRRPTIATSMSFFNTQTLCLECWNAERQDPRYAEARAAEEAACRRGFNFPGIGRGEVPREADGG
jgi:hypothetical protein